jgi:DNA-directed RNA polymerase subunit RPC12/RpoP
VATTRYTCPNCGAALLFDPNQQKLQCDYCRSIYTVEELVSYDERTKKRDQQDASRQDEKEKPASSHEQWVSYRCNSCGAEVVTDDTTSATFCYYCHSPVLITERLTGAFKPDQVIPFSISREEAIERFKAWARDRKFVPPDFTQSSQLEKMTGIYLPHWMADYSAHVNYRGTAMNRRTWMSGNTQYTEHKEYAISRHGTIDVDHVHTAAFSKFDRTLVDAITPYDETRASAFSLPYLSGFFAEKYDIEQSEVQPGVEDEVKRYAKILVEESIGTYSQVNLSEKDIRIEPKSWHYALFPAWIMTYHYRGQTYVYAVNGQTGKLYGSLPVSPKRLGFAAGLIAVAVLVLALLGGLILW